jgi:D-sedoheptulose 7-phosphate isomerase
MKNKMKYTLINRITQFQETVLTTTVTDSESNELLLETGLVRSHKVFVKIQKEKKNCYIIGNGGSAAIASHAAIDFMNVGKISAITLHDTATLTCMANDYGYENAFSNIIKLVLKPQDILIAISSSGQSKNIINSVESAKDHGSTVITLSGFDSKNPLRKMGDINFWCNSRDYGMVEIGHQFILHNLADRFMANES